jgi:hypothetical protein
MNIGIVCNDAGAANVLGAYALRNKNNYKFYLEGPALKIFSEIYGTFEITRLEELISSVDELYVGTSIISDLETKATKIAKKLGIPVSAFLDHWSLYEERFLRNGTFELPDKFVVCDQLAEDLMNKWIPKSRIKQIENPYILEINSRALKKSGNITQQTNLALWLSDPIDSSPNYFNSQTNPDGSKFTEAEAFSYFLKKIKIKFPQIERIKIRPHPSEDLNKFSDLYSADSTLIINSDRDFVEDVLSASIVGGVETMALYVAATIKQDCYLTIPNTKYVPFKSFNSVKKI